MTAIRIQIKQCVLDPILSVALDEVLTLPLEHFINTVLCPLGTLV